MALLDMESYDHYTVLTEKVSSATANVSIGAYGRNGTNGLKIDGSSGTTDTIVRSLGVNKQTLIAGVAYKPSVAFDAAVSVLEFLETGSAQIGVWLNSDGTLTVKKSRTGVALGTSLTALTLETFQYVELKVYIHNTDGWAIVKVNGSTWISVEGVDTQSTANAYANGFRHMVYQPELSVHYFDDLYICDTDGDANNDFLGDVRCIALLPDADGSYSAFTPSSGVTHYNLVNENPPDGDTTYIESTTPGNVDSFSFSSMPVASGTILGIRNNMYARKTAANPRTISPVVVIGGVVYSGTAESLGDAYSYYGTVEETNPDTGNRYTIANIDEFEFGVKLEV